MVYGKGMDNDVLVDCDGITVAHIYTCVSDWHTSPEDRRLIAAAPELLAALKVLLNQVHADCLREGEEAAVDGAYGLVERIEGEE